MHHAFQRFGLVLVAVVISSSLVRADLTITTDTTQNGGLILVNPSGNLIVSDISNDPLLTLTGSAGASGVKQLIIGNQAGEEGRLLLEGASFIVSSGAATLGSGLGSTGSATIDGSLLWSNGPFTVGQSGTGIVDLKDGGVIKSSGGTLASNSGSIGNVTIEGANTQWQNSGTLSIGISGSATLNIEDGAVVSNTNVTLGSNNLGSGSATVTGNGSQWQNNGSLIVGAAGSGILNVTNGAVVTSSGGSLGDGSGTGTATVSGAGSSWQNTGLLKVDGTGTGQLTVSDGGSVTTDTIYGSLSSLSGDGHIATKGILIDATLDFQSSPQSAQTLSFGSGGELQFDLSSGTEVLGVGYKTSGSLTISNGAVVQSSAGYLGFISGSQGTATVSGAGSEWKSHGMLNVGVSGSGQLTIQDGGQVVFDDFGWLGQSAGSDGKVIVTGAGSILQTETIGVGANQGHGSLEIENGGQVISYKVWFGYSGVNSTGEATVRGAGSLWQMNSDLTVGYDGSGTMDILDGGIVTSKGALVGRNGSGIVTVDGAGSQWLNTGSLYIRTMSIVNIENGGFVSTTDGTFIGSYPGSQNTVNVSGAGSKLLSTGFIRVGDEESQGTLNILDGANVTSAYTQIGSDSPNSTGIVNVNGDGSTLLSLVNIGMTGIGVLNVENGGVVKSSDGQIGFYSGSSGKVNISGIGSQWNIKTLLNIGNGGGSGELNVKDGGVVTSAYTYLGGKFTSLTSAILTVSGQGSRFESSNELVIGRVGVATMNIDQGGHVVSGISVIGENAGVVKIDGNNSSWQNNGTIYVGAGYGSGTLNIQNGGQFVSGDAFVGTDTYDVVSSALGVVTISGSNSNWQVNGSALVGDVYSSGQLTLENGGFIEVTTQLTIGQHGTLSGNGGTVIGDVVNQGTIAPGNSPGILTIDGDLQSTGLIQIQLAGTGTGLFDQLIVNGQLNLGGTIEIDLLDGFHPSAHNSFKIMNFDSLINSGYQFDFSHAALQPSFSWDTSTFATDGTIRVVPEASSILLAGIATFAGFLIAGTRSR